MFKKAENNLKLSTEADGIQKNQMGNVIIEKDEARENFYFQPSYLTFISSVKNSKKLQEKLKCEDLVLNLSDMYDGYNNKFERLINLASYISSRGIYITDLQMSCRGTFLTIPKEYIENFDKELLKLKEFHKAHKLEVKNLIQQLRSLDKNELTRLKNELNEKCNSTPFTESLKCEVNGKSYTLWHYEARTMSWEIEDILGPSVASAPSAESPRNSSNTIKQRSKCHYNPIIANIVGIGLFAIAAYSLTEFNPDNNPTPKT